MFNFTHGVCQARNLFVALLDDGQRQHAQVHTHDATTHALSSPLTSPARTEAAVALAEEKADTRGMHDALFHWEALLVVAAGDAKDVALPLVADTVPWHLLTHAAVHEDAEFALIFHLNHLLRPVGRVRDVELHLDGVRSRCRGGKVMDG